jgi:tetratricopeptide (TPR) repeat protein
MPSEVAESAPRVFLSYSWDEEQHQSWVKDLAFRMRTQDGLDVTLDRWAAQPGDELTLFMEKSVRESRFIVLICTPGYKAKFDGRYGGVGYEARNIAGQIMTGLATRKIIPVHRSGLWTEAAPTVVTGDFRVNFTDDPYLESEYRVLIDMLHGRREVAPPIGYGDTLFEGPGAAPAVPVANFSGRDEEVGFLLTNLQKPSHAAVCVVASGIGGMGKTSLARQFVATRARSQFPDGAAWLDAANLISELSRICRRFGWNDKNDPHPLQAATFLKNQLHNRSILIVVDNVTLSADLNLIPIPGGKCRTLITSRILSLSNDLDSPTTTITLKQWPLDICRKYFRETIPRLVNTPDADLNNLAEFVQGLPLAIRLIARSLGKTPSHSPVHYLDLLRSQPLGVLDKFATDLDRGIIATFMESFTSLSSGNKRVLIHLAACATETKTEIVAEISGLDTSATEMSLNTLADLSLAEYRAGVIRPWGLHDVLRLFVSSLVGFQDAHGAHLTWVREYQRRFADPLYFKEREEEFVEAIAAFKRLLALEDFIQASEILSQIFSQGSDSGHYSLLVGLINTMLKKIDGKNENLSWVWLGNLGLCYQSLGDIRQATDLLHQALEISERKGSLRGQAADLGNLGICYRSKGEYSKAVDFYKRSLNTYLKIDDLEGQATQLGNIGGCIRIMGDIHLAIDFLKNSLEINKSLKKPEGQMHQLANLGSCFMELGDVPKGIDFYQNALSIAQTLGLSTIQAEILGNLGLGYSTLGAIDQAIVYNKQSLEIHRRIGAALGEANQLGFLGDCYRIKGDIPEAIESLEKALTINKKFGNLEGEVQNLGNLGLCYMQIGKIEYAINYFNLCLDANRIPNIPLIQSMSLGSLGTCFLTLGDIPKAIEYHNKSLTLETQMGRPLGQATQHYGLGCCYQRMEETESAYKNFQMSLTLYKMAGLPEDHRNIGMIRNILKHF